MEWTGSGEADVAGRKWCYIGVYEVDWKSNKHWCWKFG